MFPADTADKLNAADFRKSNSLLVHKIRENALC